MNENKNGKCPNCGAPITTEICPYCHNMTGLDTKNANMEYPVIDCKEANITFWNVGFPMLFAIPFLLCGIIFTIVGIHTNLFGLFGSILFFGIFTLIGMVALVIAMKQLIRYSMMKTKGKEIEATVYGYMDDNFLLNDKPTQIVKLLVTTKEGPRFILYQLGDIKRPYKINSKIKLSVYKNTFIIQENKKNYFE